MDWLYAAMFSMSFSVLHVKYCSIIKTKEPSFLIWNAYSVAILSYYQKKALQRKISPRSRKKKKRYFHIIWFNIAFSFCFVGRKWKFGEIYPSKIGEISSRGTVRTSCNGWSVISTANDRTQISEIAENGIIWWWECSSITKIGVIREWICPTATTTSFVPW